MADEIRHNAATFPVGTLDTKEKVHFIGVAGSGVSALAQFHAMGGGPATGSDRSFDRGLAEGLRRKLEGLGIRIFPQNGSALDGSHSRAVSSAAVEEGNADLDRAGKLGLKVLHRADCLAEHVASHRTIAVAGTSGKSTVAAMIFDILREAGRAPGVITGGPLIALERQGLVGNAFRENSDLLVVEADESDGTLTRYKPWIGVLLNLSKDHKDETELREMFERFKANSERLVVQASSPGLQGLESGSRTFGLGGGAVSAEEVSLGPEGSAFRIGGSAFRLPTPGRHNVANAAAAAAACVEAGVSLDVSARALAGFQGVARRMQVVGAAGGVTVIDDFAHNPVKVAAALSAARLRSPRIHAVFQLHGYAPARFLREEFIQAFKESLGPGDTLWMPEIYYAGGTASMTVSAADIASAVAAGGRSVFFIKRREDLIPKLVGRVEEGDVVLVMGARDPSLPEFAAQILAALGKSSPRTEASGDQVQRQRINHPG